MKKLWSKNQTIDSVLEAFTTGDDLFLDQKLVPYDIYGSLAHIQALHTLTLLTTPELICLQKGLLDIYHDWLNGNFILQLGDEDVHTKIELTLTTHIGEVGKKIHTGRSRNDQVLTALRLYQKDHLLDLAADITLFATTFLKQATTYSHIPMAGFTHTQPAMPSSVGLWLASYADGLIDSVTHLEQVVKLIDQSPLGTAAGYGVALDLDRKMTADLLGFSQVQLTAPYAQQSRLTFEISILEALLHCLSHLNTFASDVIFFSSASLGYINLEPQFCSGSSIMPHKKNVDVAELLRAQYSIVVGRLMELLSLKGNLVSGYNRDFQVSKKAVVEAFDITKQSVMVAQQLVAGIIPNTKKATGSVSKELHSVDAVLTAVHSGIPFRDAYHDWQNHLTQYLHKKHSAVSGEASLGSANNIPFEQLFSKLRSVTKSIKKQEKYFFKTIKKLLALEGPYA